MPTRCARALAELGDSVVVVGGGGLWNVHVHIDDVGAAIEAGIAAGRPHRIRVTDLREEAGRAPCPAAAGRALVVVAHGPGIAALLEADGRRRGAATRRVGRRPPSCSTASTRAGADEIVLLPERLRHPRGRRGGRRRGAREGLRVAVVPTRSIVQTLAAVAVHEPRRPLRRRRRGDDPGGRRHPLRRRHDRVAGGGHRARARCQLGDVLGLVDGDIVEIGDRSTTSPRACSRRLLSGGGELVTVVRGAEADEALVDARRAPCCAASTPASRSWSTTAASRSGR